MRRPRGHHVLHPVGGLRPVRELGRRGDRLGRRAPGARRLRDRRHLHARATAPGTSPTRSRTSAFSSRATSSSRARSGARTCRSATGRRSSPRSATCSTRFPDETGVYPGHMGITTLGAERATNPFLRELAIDRSLDVAIATSIHRACRIVGRPRRVRFASHGCPLHSPPGDVRRPAVRLGRAGADLRRRSARLRARGIRADRDARLRGDRALRARGRRVHRHRPEGDVHLRGPGRAQPDASSRGDRFDLPRLRRARDAQAPAAREALVLGPLLSPRAPAGRPLPPVPPDRPRGDRHRLAARRRRVDHPAPRPPAQSSSVPGVELRLGSLGSLETRAAYREELVGYLRSHESDALRRGRARESTRTRSAPSTPTTRARAR